MNQCNLPGLVRQVSLKVLFGMAFRRLAFYQFVFIFFVFICVALFFNALIASIAIRSISVLIICRFIGFVAYHFFVLPALVLHSYFHFLIVKGVSHL